MRPGSVALLPVSTASTGLLCLSVGAHVHHGRSDTEVSVWPLPRTYHVQCVTYIHCCVIYSLSRTKREETWTSRHFQEKNEGNSDIDNDLQMHHDKYKQG